MAVLHILRDGEPLIIWKTTADGDVRKLIEVNGDTIEKDASARDLTPNEFMERIVANTTKEKLNALSDEQRDVIARINIYWALFREIDDYFVGEYIGNFDMNVAVDLDTGIATYERPKLNS